MGMRDSKCDSPEGGIWRPARYTRRSSTPTHGAVVIAASGNHLATSGRAASIPDDVPGGVDVQARPTEQSGWRAEGPPATSMSFRKRTSCQSSPLDSAQAQVRVCATGLIDADRTVTNKRPGRSRDTRPRQPGPPPATQGAPAAGPARRWRPPDQRGCWPPRGPTRAQKTAQEIMEMSMGRGRCCPWWRRDQRPVRPARDACHAIEGACRDLRTQGLPAGRIKLRGARAANVLGPGERPVAWAGPEPDPLLQQWIGRPVQRCRRAATQAAHRGSGRRHVVSCRATDADRSTRTCIRRHGPGHRPRPPAASAAPLCPRTATDVCSKSTIESAFVTIQGSVAILSNRRPGFHGSRGMASKASQLKVILARPCWHRSDRDDVDAESSNDGGEAGTASGDRARSYSSPR